MDRRSTILLQFSCLFGPTFTLKHEIDHVDCGELFLSILSLNCWILQTSISWSDATMTCHEVVPPLPTSFGIQVVVMNHETNTTALRIEIVTIDQRYGNKYIKN